MTNGVDMSKTIISRSDQLNSDDLIGGKITGTILRVFSTGSPEQPIGVDLDCWPQPWKPSKGQRRVLVSLWGIDGDSYVGRQVRLVRNPDVRYGGIAVGGVEVDAVSHIEKPIVISVTVSKGKKKAQTINPLIVEAKKPPSKPAEPTQPPPAQKANAKEIEELRQKMVIESEVMALGTAMGAVSDSAGMDAVRATFSKLSSKLTAEQRTALVALADAAKARIAAVPVATSAAVPPKSGELV